MAHRQGVLDESVENLLTLGASHSEVKRRARSRLLAEFVHMWMLRSRRDLVEQRRNLRGISCIGQRKEKSARLQGSSSSTSDGFIGAGRRQHAPLRSASSSWYALSDSSGLTAGPGMVSDVSEASATSAHLSDCRRVGCRAGWSGRAREEAASGLCRMRWTRHFSSTLIWPGKRCESEGMASSPAEPDEMTEVARGAARLAVE